MKYISKFVTILFCVCTLQGCAILSNADNLVPTPSVSEFNTFESTLPTGTNISELKSRLGMYIGEYHKRASDRRKMEWDSSGMTAYGGLAAVIGGLADKTGLLNSGAGLAGLGLMTSTRYNFGLQSQIYITAVRRLACINSKLVVVPNAVFEDAKESPDNNAAAIAQAAVQQITNLIDAIRIEANNNLLGITPTAPSRDELLAMFKSYQSPVAAAAPPGGDGLTRKKEAGEQIKLLLSDVATCTKL
jgi:hypothetical protein